MSSCPFYPHPGLKCWAISINPQLFFSTQWTQVEEPSGPSFVFVYFAFIFNFTFCLSKKVCNFDFPFFPTCNQLQINFWADMNCYGMTDVFSFILHMKFDEDYLHHLMFIGVSFSVELRK